MGVLRPVALVERRLRGTGVAAVAVRRGRLYRGGGCGADRARPAALGAVVDGGRLGDGGGAAGPAAVRRLPVGTLGVQPGRLTAALVRPARRRAAGHGRT